MATQRATIDFLLEKLREPRRFSARAMFGEYALYAEGRVVALVCDDRLYVKILPASQALESICEQGHPYLGAKLHYIVEEGQFTSLPNLASILFALAESLPAKKERTSRTRPVKSHSPARRVDKPV
jgi:TfoX/Sxy family transcriptional regulator of competence genes